MMSRGCVAAFFLLLFEHFPPITWVGWDACTWPTGFGAVLYLFVLLFR
jgi:hypothetical protein